MENILQVLAHIAVISESLVTIVAHPKDSRSAEAKRYPARMSDWETA